MATKTVLILALAFAQVLTEHVEIGFVEDLDVKVESAQSRIVSGWEAFPGQHPHMVSLRMVNGIGEVSSCGGTVIHVCWMTTAAHCTAGRITLVIRAGVTNLTTPEHISESSQWFNHPTYNDNLPLLVQPNDISLVKLEVKFVFTKFLQPIRLQPSAQAYQNYQGQVVYASGYGRTWTLGPTPEVLNWVYLTGVSNQMCAATFGSIINDNAICAQFYNVTSQSVCQGDSGGPLVHVDPVWGPTLIGVASFVAGGDFGCHSGLPGGFIRPGPFHNWFREITFIDFEEESTTTTTTTSKPPPDSDEDSNNSSEDPNNSSEDPNNSSEDPDDSSERSDESSKSKEKESGEDSSSGDNSCDDSDPDLSQLLKRLEVKVKVKVKLDKFKKKHVVHKKH